MKETDVEFLQRFARMIRIYREQAPDVTEGYFKLDDADRLLSLAEAGASHLAEDYQRGYNKGYLDAIGSLAEAGRQQDLTELLRDSLHWLKASMPEKPYMPSEEYRATVMGKLINDIELSISAPPSAPVLPEPWGPANRKGEYQVIDTVLPEPFKHPQCPRCRSLPPLRMLQQVPLIWICDCCTQAFNGELKLWSIADAVLPEGQPQKGSE